MKLRALDLIITQPFAPHKPHADMAMLGYKFICAHVSIQMLLDQDAEIETPSRHVVAVENDQGVNFYAKGAS